MQSIPERDWKILRSMKDEKIAFVCRTIFDKISQVISQSKGREHAAYLKLWKTMKVEDRKIEIMFDDPKRSTAILKLIAWKEYGLLSDEEESRFSLETQESLKRAVKIYGSK